MSAEDIEVTVRGIEFGLLLEDGVLFAATLSDSRMPRDDLHWLTSDELRELADEMDAIHP